MTQLFRPAHYLKFAGVLLAALIVMAVVSSYIPQGIARDVFQSLICPVGAFLAGAVVGRRLTSVPGMIQAAVFVTSATLLFMVTLALILLLLMWGGGGSLGAEVWTSIAIGAPIVLSISAALGYFGLSLALPRQNSAA